MALFGGRGRKPSPEGVPAPVWAFLTEGDLPEDGSPGCEEIRRAAYLGAGAEFWAKWQALVMARWLEENPGTRPWAWYQHRALPRVERLKVGGSGEQGAPISRTRVRGYFDCDLSNPPQVESEATFLRRLGLLVAGEEARVARRAWAPERLKVDAEGWAL